MSLESLLANDTALLQRSLQLSDNSGGIVKTWSAAAAGGNPNDATFPVRVQDASASTMRRYAVDNIVVTHTLFTQTGTGKKGDRWITSDSKKLLIKGVMKRRGIGGIDSFWVYDCEETMPGTQLAAPVCISIVRTSTTRLVATFDLPLNLNGYTFTNESAWHTNDYNVVYAANYLNVYQVEILHLYDAGHPFTTVDYLDDSSGNPPGLRLIGQNELYVADFTGFTVT